MIQISDNAGRQIRKLLEKQGMLQGALRVGVKAGGCSGLSYIFAWEAAPRPDDEVYEGPHGTRVLVDPRSLRFLDGTVLEYDTSLLSKGFIVENPLAKSSCGCGTSFSV
ncbi:MAG: iron-sulfur cluster assembly accessory protein [Luteitalea sp.]|nr:iron-sulfur cluster assembly accessory protein [Luteitalea sp.]